MQIYHGQCTTLKAQVKQTKQQKGKYFQKKKMYIKYEVNIMEQKQVKKAMIREKKKHTEELYEFEKVSVSNSEQESFNSSSSKEGEN